MTLPASNDAIFMLRPMGEPFQLRRHLDEEHQPPAPPLFDIVVGGVMWDVAMNQPLSRHSRRPDHVVAFARSDVHRILSICAAGGTRLPSVSTILNGPPCTCIGCIKLL